MQLERTKKFLRKPAVRWTVGAFWGLQLLICFAGAWAVSFPNVFRVFRDYGDPSEFGLMAEDVVLSGGESAWWFPQENAKRTILVCHGRSRNKSYMLPLIERLAVENQVLAIDFFSHGENRFGTTTIGWREAQSVGAAIQFLEARGNEDVVVFGVSMGAVATLIWLSDHPSPMVSGVIVDGAFARLHPYLMAKSGAMRIPRYLSRASIALAGWIAGYDPHEVNPVDGIGHIEAPLLILHAASDRMTPVGNHKVLLDAAAPDTKAVVYPGGHDEPGNMAMQVEIMDFLKALPLRIGR